MKKSCSICGCSYVNIYTFKAGHICENCVKMLKTDFQDNTHVRTDNQN